MAKYITKLISGETMYYLKDSEARESLGNKVDTTDSRLSDARPASNTVDTYSSTGTDPVSGKAVAAAIGTLDVSSVGGTNKYIKTISETNGKISATAGTVDTSVTADSSNLITSGAVKAAIDALPEPMVFKGSIGTGGTVTSLPTAAAANKGFTYKVITAGTYASQAAKVGDTFISDGSSWVLIPSGDEPSGTVTSVTIKATSPISIDSSAAITSSGTRTISHAVSGVTAGTYKSVTVDAKGHVTAGTNPTTLAGYGITDAAVNKSLTDEDLNDVTTPGFYNAGGGNTVTNKPSGVTVFGLEVIHSASGKYYTQIIYSSADAIPYRRSCLNGTWSNWVKDELTDTNTHVLQSSTTTANWRKIALGAQSNASSGTDVTERTDQVYVTPTVEVQPSTGTLKATALSATTLNGVTIGESPKFTDTNTKVTSAANHYAPTADASSELTATISGTAGAYAKDTEYTVLTGVKAQMDAKGHVTGITYTAQKIKDTNTNTTYSNMTGATSTAAGTAGLVPAPAKGKLTSFLRGDGTWVVPTDTNTTYSAGTGLSLSGTTFSLALTKKLVTDALGYTPPTTDSDITGNAATATKLKNTRTLWGNNFSGTANVGGDIILDAGDGGRQVRITKNGAFSVRASTGGMTGGLSAMTNDGSATLGTFGYYCSGDTLIRLYIGDSYSSPWASFLPTGNVGIGTVSPTEKLHVSGNVKATKFQGNLLASTINGVTVGNSPKFTDANVTQEASTTGSWRKVLLHNKTNTNSGDEVISATAGVYSAVGVSVQPSTGTLAATKFSGDISGCTGLTSSQIPSLAASKITSGTFAAARIPDLSGTYATSSRASTLEGYFTDGVANQASCLRNIVMKSGDDYDTLSDYTQSRGSFVAVNYNNATSGITLTDIGDYDTLVSFGYGNRTIQFKGAGWSDALKYRHVGGSSPYSLTDWKTIAFTDSNITGNAGSATKLANKRTLWGQEFNGTDNVSGNISNTGNITPSATVSSTIGSSTLMYERAYLRRIDTQSGYDLRFNTGGTERMTISASDGTITVASGLNVNIPKINGVTVGNSPKFTDTTYSNATTSAAGLMSAADKTKLNGIAEGANAYSLPTASASTLGGIKVGTNLSISNGVLSATDTTYTSKTAVSGGTAVSLCTTGEKYTWNKIRSIYSANGTGAVTIDASKGDIQIITMTGNISSVSITNATNGLNLSVIFYSPDAARSVVIRHSSTMITYNADDISYDIASGGLRAGSFSVLGTGSSLKIFLSWY